MRSRTPHGAALVALLVPALALGIATVPAAPGVPKPPPPQVTLRQCQDGGGSVEITKDKGNRCEGGQYDRSPVIGE